MPKVVRGSFRFFVGNVEVSYFSTSRRWLLSKTTCRSLGRRAWEPWAKVRDLFVTVSHVVARSGEESGEENV